MGILDGEREANWAPVDRVKSRLVELGYLTPANQDQCAILLPALGEALDEALHVSDRMILEEAARRIVKKQDMEDLENLIPKYYYLGRLIDLELYARYDYIE